jgi:hypothetical protein
LTLLVPPNNHMTSFLSPEKVPLSTFVNTLVHDLGRYKSIYSGYKKKKKKRYRVRKCLWFVKPNDLEISKHTPANRTNFRKEMQLYRISDFTPVLSHNFIHLNFRSHFVFRRIDVVVKRVFSFDSNDVICESKILTVNKTTAFVTYF